MKEQEREKKFSNVCWSIWARRLCFMSCLGNLFHRREFFQLLNVDEKVFHFFSFRIIGFMLFSSNKILNRFQFECMNSARHWIIVFAIKHTHRFCRKTRKKYEKFSWKLKLFVNNFQSFKFVHETLFCFMLLFSAGKDWKGWED